MKKTFKIAGWSVVSLLIIFQFFRPGLNISDCDDNHILMKEVVDGNVSEILKNACLDCHSDHTNYPWYDKIAPASWLVAYHIREGKKQLNFSTWGKLDVADKISHLIQIQEEVKSDNMPLRSYTFIHRKARLSDEQRREMVSWAERTAEHLLNNDNNQK